MSKQKERPECWTIVQHSGYGYGMDPGFMHGLEVRTIGVHGDLTPARQYDRDIKAVKEANGLIFYSYKEATDFEYSASYPEGTGLYPHALGTFSGETIDGLRIYVPIRSPAAVIG